MTPIELQKKGFQALINSLGIVDAIRFIHQYDNGNGYYTQEGHQWLEELTMDDILNDIKIKQGIIKED